MQKPGFQDPPCMMVPAFVAEDLSVPKRIPLQNNGEPFGERMARLRQAAGFTQRELAAEIGISQRMVAYYEGETEYPPAHLLPAIARAVGVSTDELLGVQVVKQQRKLGRERLWRRLYQLEKLPQKERKQVMAVIDAFLDRHRVVHAG
jgi:transcriptional regulator with XRE-family HTH domain